MKKPIDETCLHLFVPADRPARVSKAMNAGADAVVIDLEDAVAANRKVHARDQLVSSLLQVEKPVILRINAVGTPWHEDDLSAAARLPVDAVMVPKAERAEEVVAIARRTGVPVMSLIESAVGIANARGLAQVSSRLAFGSIDFAADLAMGHTRMALLPARHELVLASRLARLAGAIDGVTTATMDAGLVSADAAHAVELGMTGKLLVHPAQIEPARRGFAPTLQEVDWARRVVSSAQDGGAAKIDGAMVDAPVVARARQIMNRHRVSAAGESGPRR